MISRHESPAGVKGTSVASNRLAGTVPYMLMLTLAPRQARSRPPNEMAHEIACRILCFR